MPGFGFPSGNRFREKENDKEHRQLVKANRNRNRNIERIGCHKLDFQQTLKGTNPAIRISSGLISGNAVSH